MSISCNLFIYFEFICTCRYVDDCYHAENKYVSIIVRNMAETLTTGHLNKWNLLMQECFRGGGGGKEREGVDINGGKLLARD